MRHDDATVTMYRMIQPETAADVPRLQQHCVLELSNGHHTGSMAGSLVFGTGDFHHLLHVQTRFFIDTWDTRTMELVTTWRHPRDHIITSMAVHGPWLAVCTLTCINGLNGTAISLHHGDGWGSWDAVPSWTVYVDGSASAVQFPKDGQRVLFIHLRKAVRALRISDGTQEDVLWDSLDWGCSMHTVRDGSMLMADRHGLQHMAPGGSRSPVSVVAQHHIRSACVVPNFGTLLLADADGVPGRPRDAQVHIFTTPDQAAMEAMPVPRVAWMAAVTRVHARSRLLGST